MQIVSHFHSRKQVIEENSSLCSPLLAQFLLLPNSLYCGKGDSTAETSRCANVEEFAVYFISETTIAVNPAAERLTDPLSLILLLAGSSTP